MAYFYEVVTQQNIPHFLSAARAHKEALNVYIASPGNNGKPREVESHSTTQLVNNGVIWTTTILCCDEGDDE